ncbi:hypothetical protein [Bradyrhizobium sp. Rc2d]|uniref:hypothetical protein n=1 Tax=Bradyrhizobium sp. Rc2d TaxID=1855321 RepID=UPI00115FB38A|nr:hypothetical protein [Bradyrhizobium sp. Rc2d]
MNQRRIEQDRADREAAQIAARLASLDSLGKSIAKDECEQVADDLGLPVRGALEAMRAFHETRSAQRKAEEEAEWLERLERLKAITALSDALIGDALVRNTASPDQ